MLKLPVRANQSYWPNDFIVTKFEKDSKKRKVLLCISEFIELGVPFFCKRILYNIHKTRGYPTPL
jgi:hypothetical protein